MKNSNDFQNPDARPFVKNTRQKAAVFSILLILLLVFQSGVYGQKELDSPVATGDIDPTFAPKLGTLGVVSKTIRQPDGKIIAAGNFEQVNLSDRKNAVRFNADDTLDGSFNLAENVLGKYLEILPDGKFISLLSVPQQDALPKVTIVRLHPDGSLDNSFNFARNITVGENFRFQPRSDGKVFAVGDFKVKRRNLVIADKFMLLDQFGGIESGFNVNVTGAIRDAFSLPNGKTAICGAFEVKRLNVTVGKNFAVLNENGSIDAAFDLFFGVQSESVSGVGVQPDGKLLVYGSFSQVYKQNGFGRQILKNKGIARLNADGTPDKSFIVPFSSASIGRTLIQPDGKIIGMGEVLAANGYVERYFFRLFPDGSLDQSFSDNLPTTFALRTVSKIELQTDGKILMSGAFPIYNQVANLTFLRLNAYGSLDQTFPIPQIYGSYVNGFDYHPPDGRITIYGGFGRVNNQSRVGVARFNSLGALDENFRYSFVHGDWVSVDAVTRQADGKYLVGGNFSVVDGEYIFQQELTTDNFIAHLAAVVRLNADGSRDASFTPFANLMQEVGCLVAQPDGKILIGGAIRTSQLQTHLVRLNADGTVDAGFNRVPIVSGNTELSIKALRLQPDGKILVGGFFQQIGTAQGRNLARFNADGSFERFFQVSQYDNSTHIIHHLILQPDGKIIAGGDLPKLPRFNADGTPDMSFRWTDYHMSVGTRNIVLEPDGKILFAGHIGSPGQQPFYPDALYRMNQNGEIEAQFNMLAPRLLSQADGKFIVGRYVESPRAYRLARYFPNGGADDAFNVLFDRDVNYLVQQPDGRILVAGSFKKVNGVRQVGLVRLNP